MKNLSDHDIACTTFFQNGVDKMFPYEVWDANGKPPPMRKRKHPEIGQTFSAYPPCTLKPGETAHSSAVINTLFDLTSLGRYAIQVSRLTSDQDPKLGMI